MSKEGLDVSKCGRIEKLESAVKRRRNELARALLEGQRLSGGSQLGVGSRVKIRETNAPRYHLCGPQGPKSIRAFPLKCPISPLVCRFRH
jgi:hypothetical protein